MNVREYLKDCSKILNLIENYTEVIKYLKDISSQNDEYLKILKNFHTSVLQNHPLATNSPIVRELSIHNDKVNLLIKNYPPNEFIPLTLEMSAELKNLNIKNNIISQLIKLDIVNINKLHTEAYSTKRFNENIDFTSFSAIFIERLSALENLALNCTINLLQNENSIPSNCEVIDIYIVCNKVDFLEFSVFLKFVATLYKDLCRPLSVNYDEYPLNIQKIESGSLWSKIFGNKKIIELIHDLIFGIGNYIKDNQTGKIQLERFQYKLEAVSSAILIKQKFSDDLTAENKLLLNKIINQALNNTLDSLPKSTTEVFINDVPVLKLNEEEKKAIENGSPLMLKGKDTEDGK